MSHNVYVDGGLGNQLFQVAWALYLNDDLGKNVNIDVALLDSKKQHNGIDFRFFISEYPGINSPNHLYCSVISRGFIGKAFRFLLRKLSINRVSNYLLYDYNANMGFIDACNLATCKHHLGYFQFPEAALLARDRIKYQVDKKRSTFFDVVKASYYCNKVAVHVRRGDFLESKDSKHKAPELDYIIKAMNSFPSDTDFIVFSDDLKWCKKNLLGSNIFFSKESSAYCDFFAMTYCSKFIITGSTFGYWAVLLSDNSTNKLIVTPKNHNAQFLEEENLIKTKWVYRYV